MTVKFYMNEDVKLRRGLLSFPPEKGVPEGMHVTYLDKTLPRYRFLRIVPKSIADADLDLWALDVLGVTPRLGELEAILKGTKVRIRIPTAYLSNVSLRPYSLARVIRYVTDLSRNFSEIWKPRDFRDYQHSVSWQDIYKVAMSLGI